MTRKRIFLELPDYHDSDARNKVKSFSPQNSSTVVMFQIEIFFKEIEPVVAEEYKFGKRAEPI